MVSIVIPCYNYGRFLRDAIESGLQQQQSGLPVEVLVVDDGSTDDTPAVAAAFGDKIRYVRKENAGLSAARNTGMLEAAHDLVVFLDSDDMLAPGSVKLLWDTYHQLDPRPAVLAGLALPVDAAGKPMIDGLLEEGGVIDTPARLLVIRSRFAPGVLADRRVLLDLGGFDPALKASEDRDMWIRVAARRRVACLNRLVLLKRDHGGNMSRAARQQTACIQQVLAKAFSNPDLTLSRRDKRLAQAVCWYQSALMYAEAAEWHQAIQQMTRSFRAHPVGSMREAAIAPFSRLRGLVGMVCGSIRSRRQFS